MKTARAPFHIASYKALSRAAIVSSAKAGALLCASAYLINAAQPMEYISRWVLGPSVEVNLSKVNWWAQTRFALETPQIEAILPLQAKPAVVARKKSVIKRAKVARIRHVHRDAIRLTQAKVSSVTVPVTQDDLLEMQNLRSQIRVQLKAALISENQIATAPIQPSPKNEYSAPKVVRVARVEPRVVVTAAPALKAATRVVAPVAAVNPASLVSTAQVIASEPRLTKAKPETAPESDQIRTSQAQSIPEIEKAPTAPGGQIFVRGNGQSRVINSNPERAPAIVTTQAAPAAVNMTGTGINGYSAHALANNIKMSIQPQHVNNRPTVTKPVRELLDTQDGAGATLLAQKEMPAQAQFVEAFDWNEPVVGTTAVNFAGPWTEVDAPMHWTTLALESSPSLGHAVPLISDNSIRLLEQTHGITVSKEAALVFGRVPRDYQIQISGRAERKIFLDEPGTAGFKTFVLLNVEPGAQLLHFRLGTQSGAVAVPARGGVATFVDLTKIDRRSLRGRVLDAGRESVSGIANVRVSVVGQPEIYASTDTSGSFVISDVQIAHGHPIYLETDARMSHTHRYSIYPAQMNGELSLFRFSSKRIEDLVNQLEGGVSVQSGLVLGAIPGLVAQAKEEGEGLFASLSPIETSSQLVPETYTLDPKDHLLVNTALTPESARFVSAQVPAGLNVLTIDDQSQKVRWSEVIIASPSVVNVVTR